MTDKGAQEGGSARAYDRYVTGVADELVNRFNLHPDDAVELIDMNKEDVARWYGSSSSRVVAHRLMVRLRALVAPSASPNPVRHLGWWIGGAAALGALLAWRYANAKLQAGIQQNVPPGVTLQPPDFPASRYSRRTGRG